MKIYFCGRGEGIYFPVSLLNIYRAKWEGGEIYSMRLRAETICNTIII